MISKERTYIGILLYLAAMMFFALINSVLKKLSLNLQPFEIMAFRALLSMLLSGTICIFFIKTIPPAKLKLDNWFRAVVEVISMPLWIISLEHLHISQAVALSFTTPIFSAILAAIFLRDYLSKKILLPLLFALVGALIVVNPKAENIAQHGMLVIVVCLCWAAGNLFIKKLTTHKQSPFYIVFYNNLLLSFLAIPIIIWYKTQLSFDQFLGLGLLAFLGISGHFLLAAAYKFTKISTVVPFDYTRLIFSATFAYLIFGESLKINTFIGSAIIFTSSLYIAFKVSK